MDYNFQVDNKSLRIPVEAYAPVKRCLNCGSIYIDDLKCDSCGRSMVFHPIGEPLGVKSYYGIKERYLEKWPVFLRFFPQFENYQSSMARSYVRHLSKRFSDLLSAFNSTELIDPSERHLFFAESMELIDELLLYRVDPFEIQNLLEQNDGSLVGQELLYYLEEARSSVKGGTHWWRSFLDHRLWGTLRTEFFLKVILVTATVSTMAVVLKDLVSLQLGK